MAQIVETYCEDVSNEAVAATPDLITHVEVHKMTVHDGHRLADALDDLSERALTPAVMLGDSPRISQVSSIFSAARRRFCYKNHEVVAYMERRIWHTRWVKRNRGAFGSFLTVD